LAEEIDDPELQGLGWIITHYDLSQISWKQAVI
jgi:hypothetical protein